ncbi:LytR/AlgR family response regulator transcription factor [Peptococcus simiae]|uniref:LytR/AlgR family response regulator transcription factor n=1 Tax=Peptococcus simiae TaxID=1643805 RepID=UPI0039816C37
MRILLIEDQPPEQEALFTLLEDWVLDHKVPFDLVAGADLADLAAELTADTALAILDICLPDGNALEAVGDLRRQGFTGDVIFITAYPAVTAAVANTRPFGFVDKGVPEETLAGQLTGLLDRWLETLDRRYYSYSFNKSTYTVALDNILYFEKKTRMVRPHLLEGESPDFYGKLEEISQDLDSRLFVMVGTMYLVNIRHVRYLHQGKLIFTGGQALTFSIPLQKPLEKLLLAGFEEVDDGWMDS